jgi:hypothetical protein
MAHDEFESNSFPQSASLDNLPQFTLDRLMSTVRGWQPKKHIRESAKRARCCVIVVPNRRTAEQIPRG